jgi:alpha-beta hydrolase superfamily lysophospholipase
MSHKLKAILAALVLLPLLLYAGAGLMLARGKTLAERHVDFDEPPFDFNSDSFDDYLMYSKLRLLAARVGALDQGMLDNLIPFELEPAAECPRAVDGKAAQGILLTHGLLESAYSMREFGEFMRSQCFHVLGLLLPDHGSRPGDFLSTDWQDYSAAVAFATRVLQTKAAQVLLGGHSVGGALSILEATRNPQVQGLILFAPALAITDAARYARFIVPLGSVFPGAAWVGVDPDEALYRYESLTFTAAAETWGLLQAVKRAENAQVQNLPVLAIASMEDTTVRTPAILDFMQRNRNDHSLTILYSQHEHAGSERLKVVAASDEARGILSLSHLGLMTSPANPYYGRDGQYRNCGHYGSAANPDFVACKNGGRAWYGETTAENRQAGVLERIAFNPYYEAMTQEVQAFLARLQHDN